jgi:hypothetical protein
MPARPHDKTRKCITHADTTQAKKRVCVGDRGTYERDICVCPMCVGDRETYGQTEAYTQKLTLDTYG